MALSAAAITASTRWRLRAQKTDRAEAAHYAPRRQLRRAAREPVLFQSLEEEPGGSQPAPLPEVAGWQERVQRHTVEHLADIYPSVQIPDARVPRMEFAGNLNSEDEMDAVRLLHRPFTVS